MKRIKYAGCLYEVIEEIDGELTLRSVRDSRLVLKARNDSALLEKISEEKEEKDKKEL